MSRPLQCLNALRIARQQVSRAPFSTTARALAERSVSDDLLSLAADTSPSPRSSSAASQPTGTRVPFSARPRAQPGSQDATRGVLNLVDRVVQRNNNNNNNNNNHRKPQQQRASSTPAEEFEKLKLAGDLSKQIIRRWKAGDVYAPHDLSSTEMRKWRQKGRPEYDVFDILNINPINEYKNFSMMSEYITPMGRIKHSKETGLRPVNQRRISKAIRRAVGLGHMPSIYHHPEILRKEVMRRHDQITRSTRQF